MQLRRNYNIARRTMNAEDFAVFNAAYSEQMTALTDQYMALREQLSAANTDYRNLVNSLRSQLNDERQIRRALWIDLKTACTQIDEGRKAERAASNQLRADYNATIQALNEELSAAREKERDIRENSGS